MVVCICGFCNVWLCVCVGFVMCGCEFGVFSNVCVCVCVCVGFVMCACVFLCGFCNVCLGVYVLVL